MIEKKSTACGGTRSRRALITHRSSCSALHLIQHLVSRSRQRPTGLCLGGLRLRPTQWPYYAKRVSGKKNGLFARYSALRASLRVCKRLAKTPRLEVSLDTPPLRGVVARFAVSMPHPVMSTVEFARSANSEHSGYAGMPLSVK
jgi:hypothetical protein